MGSINICRDSSSQSREINRAFERNNRNHANVHLPTKQECKASEGRIEVRSINAKERAIDIEQGPEDRLKKVIQAYEKGNRVEATVSDYLKTGDCEGEKCVTERKPMDPNTFSQVQQALRANTKY